MPSLPLHKCAMMSCTLLTNQQYCIKHQQEHEEKRRQKKLESDRDYYKKRDKDTLVYGYNWKRFRHQYLMEYPLCEMCYSKVPVKYTTATVIHHIQAIKDGGEIYDKENLMPLCFECHETIEKRRKPRYEERTI